MKAEDTRPPVVTIEGGPNDGHTLAVEAATMSLGRSEGNDVVIRGSGVSRHHAEILRSEGRYYLRDLNSTNGTSVGGVPLTGAEHLLRHGDVIQLGTSRVSLVFRTEDSATVKMQAVRTAPEVSKDNTQDTPTARPSEPILRYLKDTPGGADWSKLESLTGLAGQALTQTVARLVTQGQIHQQGQVFYAGADPKKEVSGAPQLPEHFCQEHRVPFDRYKAADVVVYGHTVGGQWCMEDDP